MAEELGKIEKPLAADFKTGRKLYFVPLVYRGQESPPEYLERYQRYWQQVAGQLDDLEAKLGRISKLYHELITDGGEEGLKVLKELNEPGHRITQARREKGTELEATEALETLTEFMDWSRCLMVGLQNQAVFNQVYRSYTEAGKKRNEHISRHLDETLGENETAVLFMAENHQVAFPPDIQVFYVAPPALDEIKRWLRDREAKPTGDNPPPPPD
ncbi:MAG: hypothetical protein V1780_02255 [Chloroflexota bacterium]